MITTISKCLAVFTAAASLLFLGFAVISTAAGPNWESEIDELPQFTFSKTTGEQQTTWSVKERATEETVPVTYETVLASAVIAARERLKEDQKERLEALEDETRTVGVRLSEAKRLIELDTQAIDKRIAQLDAELADLNAQILAKIEEGTRIAEQISTVQADTEERREEVIRLEVQLKEIRADKFRALEQKKKLSDLLVRVNGNIERVERRNRQLRQRLNKPPIKPYEEDPSKTGGE